MQIMTSLASALSIELQLASGRTNDVIVRFIKFYSKSMEVRILFVQFKEDEKIKRKIIAGDVIAR